MVCKLCFKAVLHTHIHTSLIKKVRSKKKSLPSKRENLQMCFTYWVHGGLKYFRYLSTINLRNKTFFYYMHTKMDAIESFKVHQYEKQTFQLTLFQKPFTPNTCFSQYQPCSSKSFLNKSTVQITGYKVVSDK